MPKRQKLNDLENVQTPELQLKSKKELLKENKKLSKLIKMKSEQLKKSSRFLRGSGGLVIKLRKKLLEANSHPNTKYVLKETFANRKGASSPTNTRTSEFISKVRFL